MLSETQMLERFEQVRRQRDGDWLVTCPAHADRTPSLHVTLADDRWLLDCKAGCTAADVLAAAQLGWADLFAENGNGHRIVATYPYVDEGGELLFEVVRFEPKDFRQRKPDGVGGWLWKLGDTRRVPYRLPRVREAIASGEDVMVVEGEKDADALHRLGVAATCNPGGAGKWKPIYNDFLIGAKVTIVADRDDPGRAHARQVAEALQGVAATVDVVESAVGKDVTDHLAAGRGIAELVAVTGGGAGKVVLSHLTDFTEIVAKPVRWAWQDRAALAKITALAGRPKIGKGLLYAHLIAQVTRGTLPGDLDDPRNAILVTTEDEPGDTIKPRLVAAGADLSRVSIFQMGAKDEPVPFRVPQDAAELGRRVAEKQAALVVIDPLMEFIDGKVDSHKSHPVRQAIAALNQIARDHQCAALVVLHLNKGASTDPLLRHEGSAAFTQVVRGGLMLGQDPDDPDGEDGRRRVLAVSSSNLAAIATSIVYRIDTARVTGDAGEEIVTAKMLHVGESGAGAHDLLGGLTGEQRTVTDEAATFLRAELTDGPRLASEIKTEARKLGLSDMALFRARQTLGVKASKTGFKGGWEWALPEDFIAPADPVKSSGVKSSQNPSADAGLSLVEPSKISPSSNVKSSVSARWDEATAEAEIERLARKQAEAPACSCLHPKPMLDGHCETCFDLVPAEWRGGAL